MKFDNPTALQIGHEGILARRRYRVVGRVVLGMEEAGETYYWNEYNLRDDSGRQATLVHEQSEGGAAWRLFTLFEPQRPLSAREAEALSPGQTVYLDGVELKVELVDSSRVHHIEGEPPEGVELGDEARYFNARSADRMVVVSWSGDEVEHFHGLDLSAELVSGAFNLPLAKNAGTPGGARRVILALLAVAAVLVLVVVVVSSLGRSRPGGGRTSGGGPRMEAPQKRADPQPLGIGWSGHLGATEQVVIGSLAVATAQPGRNYNRRDYLLKGLDGTRSLLFNGLGQSGLDSYLTESQAVPPELTPQKAALLRPGSVVTAGIDRLSVDFLFRSRTIAREGELPPSHLPGATTYHCLARNGAEIWIFGWDESGIRAWKGVRVEASAVARSLLPATEAAR